MSDLRPATSDFTVLMLGTGPFAVPTFRQLLDRGYRVAALVTRPPRPVHGKKDNHPTNPMRALAEERGLPVLTPESINTDEARDEISQFAPDLLVVCDYGQLLAPATLTVAHLGGINLHASLLPKYRGAAPINWAMYHGERETGVTVIHMTPQLDAGPSIAQAKTTIGPDETAVELEPRLAELGAPLVIESIELLRAGKAQPIAQDGMYATRAPRLKKIDGLVDWSRSSQQIHDQVRAFQPWPATFTFWHRPDGPPLRLILDRVSVASSAEHGPPGTVLEAGGDQLLVATGDGALLLERLQPAGKRILPTAEFLRGYPVQRGERFGDESGEK
jgi:methionyl-tRNA formyltransferase